ncbi:MAG: hypothetical protein ACO263_03120 [Cyclobacteriaceae bacterium]|jgi:hypothetical protein
MMDYPEFIADWNQFMTVLALVSTAVALGILIFHNIRKTRIKDYKERYDFITDKEVTFLWYFLIGMLIAGVFYSNTLISEWIENKGMVWFAGRFFISICAAILFYQLLDSLVRIYYVGKLEEKLKVLRNKPRLSPDGNVMRKLTESEEDAHLDSSQIAEEANSGGIHSFNYDVWIDDKTGYKRIEKYDETLHPIECSECGYITLRVTGEEITVPATETEKGVLTRHYKCTFCKHRERRDFNLASTSEN